MRVAFELFGEDIRQAGEATSVHSKRQVSTFRVGRADVLHAGLAFDPLLLGPDSFRAAVAAFGAADMSMLEFCRLRHPAFRKAYLRLQGLGERASSTSDFKLRHSPASGPGSTAGPTA